MLIKVSNFLHFQFTNNVCQLLKNKKPAKYYKKIYVGSEIQPLPRPLQANSTNSPSLPLVSHFGTPED
jgi:hypothetical protein